MLNLDTTLARRLSPTRFDQGQARTELDISWASTWAEVREAQRLRYRVFALEMGARVPSQRHGLDADEFDAYCDHLLVRECADGAVIGTYRVLTPQQASAAGGLYNDQEFDLEPLQPSRSGMAALGRACVAARHRHGGVVLALWRALAAYMVDRELQSMICCCSVPLADGGAAAASLWRRLSRSHGVAAELQVTPRLPFPVHLLHSHREADAPALLKGYLRLGARVLGAPAWDPELGCADLPLLLRLEDVPARYRSHFWGRLPA
jgi:putative hemolysin